MKRILLLSAGVFLFSGTLAGAADLTVADALKETKVNGFLSAAYNHNFNEPYTRAINLRPFNNKDKSFLLEDAQLVFHKDASEAGSAGYRLDLNFGYSVPSAIHSTGYTASGDFDIKQAFVTYVAPVGSGLKLDVGKFITEMGAEVIEGYEDWNWNYSRSFLFYYSIPFTHTGVRATYALNEKATIVGMVANGWDNVTDNNGGKTVCVHAALTPTENLTVNAKYIVGAEQDNNNDNLRHVFNLNLTATLMPKLVFKADYVYGTEESVPSIGDSKWTGFAGYFRYSVNEKLALNLRGEVFNDDDGARTGTAQDLWEVTFTPEYVVNNNLLVRAEYRHDRSDKAVFDREGGTSREQDTLAMNVIYHF